ncbi:hypothetical protein [Scleromatobacter humisilvae]|uniref:Uncharacterized protein n=1 Tax=Scleromatobacter humisilvae TaxID=2897159 RepID=A0A9X2C2N5_9BURK|nr:hypothetical protein [Scleromatobacter humisilvae]MCK9688906.1 hypothetical protein [Scleromatobacter humisilvae]
MPYRFHVKPKLRAEIESVLDPGESVQAFFEKAIIAEIARRRQALSKSSTSDELSHDTLDRRPRLGEA